MQNLYPFLLKPIPREIVWGGHALKDRYHKSAPFDKLAESWELSVRPEAQSVIANGTRTGETLASVLTEMGEDEKSFPLLIKFIDACDRLSIQVHPDDDYAQAHEGELGKTEMWYIIEAKPGAQLVYGLKSGVTAEDFADAVQNGNIEDTLHFVDVHPGETYFIPSGQLHAIGAGILLAEIQQNSNITYRVYDYNRRQADGSLRALHTAQALETVKLRTEEEIQSLRFAHDQPRGMDLAACDYFHVWKIDSSTLPYTLTAASGFIHLLCISGEGVIECDNLSYPVHAGDSYFIPRGCPSCSLKGAFTALLSEC